MLSKFFQLIIIVIVFYCYIWYLPNDNCMPCIVEFDIDVEAEIENHHMKIIRTLKNFLNLK